MKHFIFTIGALLLGGITAQAQFADYQSVLREDRMWVNYYDYNNLYYDETNGDITTKPYTLIYTYELKGDTVVDDKSYKKCYMRISEKCDLGAGCDVKDLSLYSSNPVALVREEGMKVVSKLLDYPKNLVPDYFYSLGMGDSEYVSYDFEDYRQDVINGSCSVSLVNLGGHDCNLYNRMWPDIVLESVGPCSGLGTLLFSEWAVSTGMIFTESGLSHVLDGNGNIIYKSPEYHNTITAINDITIPANVVDEHYYNLQGQRVDNPTPGIYIHGGKKVVVK